MVDRLSYINEELLRIKFERSLKFRMWVLWRQREKLEKMRRNHYINVF